MAAQARPNSGGIDIAAGERDRKETLVQTDELIHAMVTLMALTIVVALALLAVR